MTAKGSTSQEYQHFFPAAAPCSSSQMSANLACGGWYWGGQWRVVSNLSVAELSGSVSFSRGGKGVQRKNQNNPSFQALEYLNWAQISPSTSQSLLWNRRTDDDLQQFGMIYTHTACVTLQCYFKTYKTSQERVGVRFRFVTPAWLVAHQSCRTSFSCASPQQIRGTGDLIHIAFAIVYFRSNSI